MKIDKEKFDKLKQLDRIEFRQKLDKIENMSFSIIDYVWYCSIISMVFLTGMIISKELILIELFIKIMAFTMFLFFIEIVICISSSCIRLKNRRELIGEYFKIEVKK